MPRRWSHTHTPTHTHTRTDRIVWQLFFFWFGLLSPFSVTLDSPKKKKTTTYECQEVGEGEEAWLAVGVSL